MTTVLVRRFLLDHARNRTTAVVLVLVPVAFVLVAAPTLADAARLLGGRGGGPAVEVATAGWAAAFVTGMAMYLQVTDSREADRRLVLAGAKARHLAAARVLVGLVLAAVSAAAAFGALVLRVRVDQPLRVAMGAFLAALAYLVVGAVVGTLVRVPVNGAVLILFIWIVDVFFGPNLSGTATPALRVMPLHYVSLWTTRVASGHAGRAGDLGLALGWAAGSLLVTAMVIALGARPHRRRTVTSRPGSARDQLGAALGVGWRELRRNPVLWGLLALVPAVFVLLSAAITPSGATPVVVVEHLVRLTQVFDPAKIHAGTMAPIAVASLAALVGVFLSVDSGPADRRLVLAGLRPGALAGGRGLVVAAAALGVTAVTAGVTATVFDAQQWPAYVLANTLLALIYAALGALAAPAAGTGHRRLRRVPRALPRRWPGTEPDAACPTRRVGAPAAGIRPRPYGRRRGSDQVVRRQCRAAARRRLGPRPGCRLRGRDAAPAQVTGAGQLHHVLIERPEDLRTSPTSMA